jgi:leucyl aminopeptidase (aminopeptidase T)
MIEEDVRYNRIPIPPEYIICDLRIHPIDKTEELKRLIAFAAKEAGARFITPSKVSADKFFIVLPHEYQRDFEDKLAEHFAREAKIFLNYFSLSRSMSDEDYMNPAKDEMNPRIDRLNDRNVRKRNERKVHVLEMRSIAKDLAAFRE